MLIIKGEEDLEVVLEYIVVLGIYLVENLLIEVVLEYKVSMEFL